MGINVNVGGDLNGSSYDQTINVTIQSIKGASLPVTLTPDTMLWFNGSAWVCSKLPYDIAAYFVGKPTASLVIAQLPFARTASFNANLAGSYAKSTVAATASTTFSIQKNGSQIGTMVFAAGQSTATFTLPTGQETIAVGDIITIVGPATPDSTLANISFCLKCNATI